MKTRLILAYLVAGGGLIVRVVLASGWSERLVALALLLFAVDLARMALVDAEYLRIVRHKLQYSPAQLSQLTGFAYSLIVTVALELVGLLTSWRWVGLGIAIVMFSQLVFNLSVKVALRPRNEPPVRSWPISERVDVLIADAVAFGLALAWTVAGRPIGIAIALLAMTMAYIGLKYIPRHKE